jgi:hypothetical protein
MTILRWILLAALVTLIVLLQSLGLQQQVETKEEDRYRRVADIPASDMVPTYVASLFFGAFRAVVVDALWIQLKKVEEEKRWYEQRQTLQLISYFQPRNPEVWAHLGWHSAYNVANGFTDPEKSWEWVKFGLKWLRQGNTMLPDSTYLKFELARTLYFKPTWRDGVLDMNLLARIEGDPELQEILQIGPPAPRPLTAFELAIPWLEHGRDELLERPEKYIITQTGLYIRPLTMDGYIRECLYFQGMYLWRLQRWEEAKEAFRRLTDHTAAMLDKKYPGDFRSGIFEDHAKFSARLPEIVDLDRKAKSGKREDELALLAKMQSLLVDLGPLDLSYFWNRYRKDGRLDTLKRKLAGGRDPQECNDSFDLATDLPPLTLIAANLDPPGLDVDYYRIAVLNPAPEAPSDASPTKPVPLTIHLHRPEGATLDLKATLFDTSRRPLRSVEGRGDFRLEQACDRYGIYFLKVEPLSPVGPWPPDTSYTLRYELGS